MIDILFSIQASQRCWATSVASSSSTRWSSVCGCWPSVLSSASSWEATTLCRHCPTSSRSLSRRRSLESFWLPSGYVEKFSLGLTTLECHFSLKMTALPEYHGYGGCKINLAAPIFEAELCDINICYIIMASPVLNCKISKWAETQLAFQHCCLSGTRLSTKAPLREIFYCKWGHLAGCHQGLWTTGLKSIFIFGKFSGHIFMHLN